MSCPRCGYDPDAPPPEPWKWRSAEGYLVLVIILIVVSTLVATLLSWIWAGCPSGGGGVVNVTQDMGGAKDLEDPYMFGAFAAIAIIAVLAGWLLERNRERCPTCGEVLRLVPEVDKYKCLHCGEWFDRDDIDLPEGVGT